MGATLAELIILAGTVLLAARILEPLRRRVEAALLGWLAPGRRPIIDAEVSPTPKNRKE